MINILITSASRKVSLIKAFQEALKKEGGGKIIAGDSSLYSATLFFADDYCILPNDSDSEFLDKIFKICKKYKIKLIIPTRDEELLIFSKNRELFKNKRIEVVVSSENSIEICQDKLKFFKFCQSNGFGCPKIYNPVDIENKEIKFPLFLNGRISKASKNAFKINNKEELNFYVKLVKNPIVQEYVEAKEYTIDLFADFEGKIISAVSRERIKIFGGESFVSKTFKNNILINESVKLAEKLKLIGHNTVQCFFDGEIVKFIEVNPRYGGAVNLSIMSGADTPRFLIKIMKGENVAQQIGKFEDNLVMLRYTNDFFIKENKIKIKKI